MDVVKDDFELLFPLPLTSKSWEFKILRMSPCIQIPQHWDQTQGFMPVGPVPFHLNYIWPQLRPQLCPQPPFSQPCLGPQSSSWEEALLCSIAALTALPPLTHTHCSPPKSLPSSRTPSYLCYQLQGLSPENGTPSFTCSNRVALGVIFPQGCWSFVSML